VITGRRFEMRSPPPNLLSVFVALLLLSPTLSLSTSLSTGTATPISHVIIVVQENHSFDNYFGTYPTANGTLVDDITSKLKPVNGIPKNVCVPYGVTCVRPTLTTSSSPQNPNEGLTTYENDYGGNGTGFAENSGPQSMVYFDYESLAGYWDYAEEYGLGDSYFAAVLSMTTPNRLMMLAADSSVAEDNGPPPFLPYSSTVLSQLDARGITWGYYDGVDSFGSPSNAYPLNYLTGLNPLAANKIQDISDLYRELESGSQLPAVSFVSTLVDFNLTEHPPSNPTNGELWVVSLVNRVMGSRYWNSTTLFITWDEGGGFYDHVLPPRVFTLDHGFARPLVGLGQRVPLLVLSPYSKENYVSDNLLSHLSILHFIDYNWNFPPLNDLVAGANLPTDFFDFSQTPRAPIILGGANSSLGYPIPLQRFSASTTSGGSLPQTGSFPTVYVVIGVAAVAGAALLVGGWKRLNRT
jgi:phospholipase C